MSHTNRQLPDNRFWFRRPSQTRFYRSLGDLVNEYPEISKRNRIQTQANHAPDAYDDVTISALSEVYKPW